MLPLQLGRIRHYECCTHMILFGRWRLIEGGGARRRGCTTTKANEIRDIARTNNNHSGSNDDVIITFARFVVVVSSAHANYRAKGNNVAAKSKCQTQQLLLLALKGPLKQTRGGCQIGGK